MVVRAYIDDLGDADLLVRVVPGTNPIAWQLGHLTVGTASMLRALGQTAPELPADFEQAYLVAVCNSPARRDCLIERLSESLSGSLRIVTVPPDCSDVLELVCRSTAPGEDDPIVVIGLEKGIIAEDFKHPRIAALNHRRDQWRQSIPQPVLFWVPEYLRETLARGATDFLDWRAGTFLFVDHASVRRQPHRPKRAWRQGRSKATAPTRSRGCQEDAAPGGRANPRYSRGA